MTHSLKAPGLNLKATGFNPHTYKVNKLDSKFSFERVNLYRYAPGAKSAEAAASVGLCTLESS
jgi:hypothetical protein